MEQRGVVRVLQHAAAEGNPAGVLLVGVVGAPQSPRRGGPPGAARRVRPLAGRVEQRVRERAVRACLDAGHRHAVGQRVALQRERQGEALRVGREVRVVPVRQRPVRRATERDDVIAHDGLELQQVGPVPRQEEPVVVRALLPERLSGPARLAHERAVHLGLVAEAARIAPLARDRHHLGDRLLVGEPCRSGSPGRPAGSRRTRGQRTHLVNPGRVPDQVVVPAVRLAAPPGRPPRCVDHPTTLLVEASRHLSSHRRSLIPATAT